MKKVTTFLLLLAALLLVGCGRKAEEKGPDPVQLQRWKNFLNNRKFVRAYQVAQQHLPESYATKALRHAIWRTTTGEIRGDKDRWGYVGKIIALEKDPQRRQGILKLQFELMEGTKSPAALYDGLLFLKRFNYDSVYMLTTAQRAYDQFLKHDKRRYALYTAKYFNLGEGAMAIAMAKVIEHHRTGIYCAPVQMANDLDYTSAEVEKLRRWCIRKFPKDRRFYEKKGRVSKKGKRRKKTVGGGNRSQSPAEGLEGLRPRRRDLLETPPTSR